MSENKIYYSYNTVKKNYYNKYKFKEISHPLEEDSLIVRLDGKGMTKFFKKDQEFHIVMKNVLKKIPKHFPYISFAYTFSDEISLLLNIQKLNKNKWYKNRQEKILTAISSFVSLLFNQRIKNNNKTLFVFDARLIKINTNEYIEYFKARQAFSFSSFFDFVLSKKQKSTNVRRNLLDLERILSKKKYKDYSNICYGYMGFYLNKQWKVEIAKNIESGIKNIPIK